MRLRRRSHGALRSCGALSVLCLKNKSFYLSALLCEHAESDLFLLHGSDLDTSPFLALLERG